MIRATLDPNAPYRRHPLQPHQLRDHVTPTEDVIVLCHFGVPRLDAAAWSLSLDGLVRRPLRLTLAELARRPRTEVVSIHQCCGSPLKPEEPTRRVCNVRWSGVRLADLLDECEPLPAARFIWSSGADHGDFGGVRCDAFVKDLPLERASADVLIAYEVNGAPLPPEHGFPARLVVPGFYGTNSVKWLTRLTLAERRADSLFTTRFYNDAIRDASGQPTGETRPVWSIAPESVIVAPAPEQTFVVGESVEVWGWAWADGGVDQIELSDDGASTWVRAAIERANGRAWQRFSAVWKPARRGPHALSSRAHADGRSQPDTGARNAVHHVPVEVV